MRFRRGGLILGQVLLALLVVQPLVFGVVGVLTRNDTSISLLSLAVASLPAAGVLKLRQWHRRVSATAALQAIDFAPAARRSGASSR